MLGPYFFDDVNDGDLQTCTVTSTRYLDMLTHCAIPKLPRQNAPSEVMWTQDGAPPHLGSSVECFLSQHLPSITCKVSSYVEEIMWKICETQ